MYTHSFYIWHSTRSNSLSLNFKAALELTHWHGKRSLKFLNSVNTWHTTRTKFSVFLSSVWRWSTSVSTVTRLKRWKTGVQFPARSEIFLLAAGFRPALIPTQPLDQLVRGYFPRVKRPEREADHSHLVPTLRMSGAIPPLHRTSWWAWCVTKHRDNLTLFSFFLQTLPCSS